MKAVIKSLLEGLANALVFNLGPRVIFSDVNDQQFVDNAEGEVMSEGSRCRGRAAPGG
jgi:hypothetical protein